MKIINKEEKKVTIILDEEDILEISSLYGNTECLVVKCLNSSLHVDELTISEIKEKSLEAKEIEKMKKLLENEE